MQAAQSPFPAGVDFARLIETHQAGVWRYLRAIGCEPALADDLTQETFLAVMQRPFQEWAQSATAVYLRKTAHNLFVSYQRRAGKVVAMEELELLDRTWARWVGEDNGEDLLNALKDCLRALSDRARKALEMRFRDGCSRSEIATHLALSEDGAKNLMQRAKQQLRHCIDGKLQ